MLLFSHSFSVDANRKIYLCENAFTTATWGRIMIESYQRSPPFRKTCLKTVIIFAIPFVDTSGTNRTFTIEI